MMPVATGLIRAAGVAIIGLLAACASPQATAEPTAVPSVPAPALAPSATPTPAATATPSATPVYTATSQPSEAATPEVATPAATPEPAAASADLVSGWRLGDILRVEVNGLAVRRAPFLTSTLVTGLRLNEQSWDEIGEIRLDAGQFVSVDLGPLVIGDRTWYRVLPAENAQRGYSTISWDSDASDGPQPGPGWVAASVGEEQYLSLYEQADMPSPLSGLPMHASGTGDFVSGPAAAFDLFGLWWAFAVDDHPAPCDFKLTLVPVGGGEPTVALDVSTIGAFDEGHVHLSVPVAADSGAQFEVHVASGCEWSFTLVPLGHD